MLYLPIFILKDRWHHWLCNVCHLVQNGMVSSININIGKDYIFHRPDETMLFVMVRTCLCWKNILLLTTLEEFSLL